MRAKFRVTIFDTYSVKQSTLLSALSFVLGYIVVSETLSFFWCDNLELLMSTNFKLF